MMGFPHALLMQEWLDGARLQYQAADTLEPDVWLDIPTCEVAHRAPSLYTDGKTRYRIRPQILRWRVALMRNERGHWTRTVVDLQHEQLTRTEKEFSRWLTDWQEAIV